MNPLRPWGLGAALLLTLPLATATTAPADAPAGAKADPANPAATVPAATYQSAFRAYRAYRVEDPKGWKAANDEVTRIGGWRAYARDVQQPDAPVSAPAPAPTPAPAAPPAHKHH